MIEKCIEANNAAPVDVAFVDEAQDLTSLQWRFVWCVFRDAHRVYIAGDDDQAIYQWSGADVHAFLSIPGERQVLAHSYRLPDNILKLSKTITAQIAERVEKDYTGVGRDGSIEVLNSFEGVDILEGKTYLFLSRNNKYLYEVEEYLREKGVLYYLKSKPSILQADVKAIQLYEDCRRRKEFDVKSMQILSLDLRKDIAAASLFTMAWFEAFAWDMGKKKYIREVIRQKRDLSKILVRVSTIHSVKGSEADHVILLLDMLKSAYKNLQDNPDAEHRVFYVGVTRAKASLTIVYGRDKCEYPLNLEAV